MSTSFLQVCLSPQGFCQGYWCLPEAPPAYPGVTLGGGWDKPPGLLSLCWQGMDLGGYYFPALASTESLPASLFTRGMSVSQQWEMRTFNSQHLRWRKALAVGISGNPAAGLEGSHL